MAGAEVLITSQEFDGVTVRPLTLGKLIKLAPAIDRARELIAAAGLTEAVLIGDPLKVAIVLAPVLPELLAGVTDKTVEEVNDWLPDRAVGVLILALRQNLEYLRKLFGPALQSAITAVAATGSSEESNGSSPEVTESRT